MAWCINEVELIGFAISGTIIKCHALCLDCDAALSLDIHRVENLLSHFTRRKPTANLNKAASNGGFPMMDVRDNREVSDITKVGHSDSISLQPVGLGGLILGHAV